MVVWRYVNRVSILKKQRSFCDFCQKKLKWYDNIPIVSYILLKGKSRCCGKKLPLIYPLTELTMGLLFLSQFSLFNFLILTLLVIATRIDIEKMILPDEINLTLIIISIVYLFFKDDWQIFLWSGVGSFLFFLILNRIKIRGSEAMGMGDVKYAIFMGLFLGFPKIVVAIYLAFVVGAVVSLGLIVFKRVKKTDPIPFGPFLILGTILAWFLPVELIVLSLIR
jgi:prepilin signal peptidase PulO-like enzyme (type II secretory pathway)